jgi:hypothetical protein
MTFLLSPQPNVASNFIIGNYRKFSLSPGGREIQLFEYLKPNIVTNKDKLGT